MKNFKNYIAYLAIFALFFTSCSKDEVTDVTPDQDTFQLQFGTLLNDFAKQSKDHLSDDPVVCRDAAPSYVLVALTDSNNNWVAGKNPEAVGADENDFIKVNIKNNAGSWETDFSDELGLPAGTYQLQYFIVYSADNQVLWVAPREGGAYASSVGDPLPQEIVLAAGTKPYVEVDVLCFIPRVEEAFGYIFFDINLITVENNYCIFVNFCNEGDEGDDGREYPAKFEVDVWADGFGGSEVIIDGAMNSVSGEGNNFAATVLCFPLPPLEGDDTYFVRVTVLTAGNYTADGSDFFEFEISQADIDGQLLQTPRYEHIRINCGEDDCDPDDPQADCDNDGIPNEDDECEGEGVRGNVDEFGCPLDGGNLCDTVITCEIGDDAGSGCDFTFINGDAGDEIFVKVNSDLDVFDLNNVLDDKFGELTTAFDDQDDLVVTIDNNVFDELISKYEIEVHPADESGAMITTCQDMACDSNVTANTSSINVELTNDVVTKYPFYIRVKSTGCFSI